MEDGFSLLREFLRPHLTGPAPEFEAPQKSLHDFETVLVWNLQRAAAFGARDIELRAEAQAGTGAFTVVELSDTAPGLSLTRLRRWLTEGAPGLDSGLDWTLPPLVPPMGPAGSALTRFRTAHAGQTVEAWILPDGTWEIHLVSEATLGNRTLWYLRAPEPEAVLLAIRRCLQERCAPGSLRFFVQDQRLTLDPSPPDSLLHVRLDSPASWSRLDLISGTQGEISLYHRGFLLQKGPCPVPQLCFSWNTGYRPEIGDAAAAVARDFSAALKNLEDTLVSGLNAGTVSARLWALFLASAPAPEVLDRPLGRDLLGQTFTTRDLIEKTVLPISPVRTLPPGGSSLLLLDEALWSPAILERLRTAAARLDPGLDLEEGAGIAARRWSPAPEDPRMRWPRLWEALAEREPRLAFSGGLVLAELHRPGTQAWPFFPVDEASELARLRALPPVPWNLHSALWLAVNHPLMEHLATIAEPADAVWILARLFLLSQDLEPDDGSLP